MLSGDGHEDMAKLDVFPAVDPEIFVAVGGMVLAKTTDFLNGTEVIALPSNSDLPKAVPRGGEEETGGNGWS